MNKGTELILWIVALLLPALVLTVALVFLSRPKPPPPSCADPATCGAESQSVTPVLSESTLACGRAPITCNLNTPETCHACGEQWTCQSVEANDTDFGVEGSFCLPQKPTTACTQLPTDSNERMQGVWRWQGWAGVNVQKWECACPYPSAYPMDMSAGSSSGACKKSSQLCRGGTWTYPCQRTVACSDPSNPSTCALDVHTCEALTPDERDALLGADVLQYGLCACEDGHRLAMAPTTGLPVCVKDTCGVTPSCDGVATCPGGASCVNGRCARATSSCTIDKDCGAGGRCESNGTCTWGHWKTLPVAPYVFGECECPERCESVGSLCVC